MAQSPTTVSYTTTYSSVVKPPKSPLNIGPRMYSPRCPIQKPASCVQGKQAVGRPLLSPTDPRDPRSQSWSFPKGRSVNLPWEK